MGHAGRCRAGRNRQRDGLDPVRRRPMMRQRHAIGLLALTALLFAVLAFPIARSARAAGHIPIRQLDDGAYFSRIQTAMLGRSGPYENGITGPEFEIRAAGPGLLEHME